MESDGGKEIFTDAARQGRPVKEIAPDAATQGRLQEMPPDAARQGRRLAVIAGNIAACHGCPRRQRACAGVCACQVDGVDVLIHARTGDCPLGKHRPAPQEASGLGDQLGDRVALVAKWVGADRLARVFERVTGRSCGCSRRRKWLNRLGSLANGPLR